MSMRIVMTTCVMYSQCTSVHSFECALISTHPCLQVYARITDGALEREITGCTRWDSSGFYESKGSELQVQIVQTSTPNHTINFLIKYQGTCMCVLQVMPTSMNCHVGQGGGEGGGQN